MNLRALLLTLPGDEDWPRQAAGRIRAMGARALALALPAAPCFVNRRDRMAGLLQMIALALRLGHWRRVPMSMTACPRLGDTLLGRVDGCGAAGLLGYWADGLRDCGAVPGPDSDRPWGRARAVQARPDRRPRAGVARHSDSASRRPPRRIRAPIAPGCVQRSAASGIHRLSALENGRRRARGTGSRVGAGSWRRRRSGRVASREVSSAKRSDRRFRPRPGALLAGRDPRLSRL